MKQIEDKTVLTKVLGYLVVNYGSFFPKFPVPASLDSPPHAGLAVP